MQAITLNLLAEEQLVQHQRARDPVKVAVAVGISLVAVAIASGALLGGWAGTKKFELGGLESKWDKIQKAQPAAGEVSVSSVQQVAADLVAINQGRILIAPQLALLKDIIPPSVQLRELGLTVQTKDSVPPPANPSDLKARLAARPTSSQRLVLRLDGRAISDHPELEVDKFLQSLRANPTFNEQVEDIQLQSIVSDSTGTDGAPGVPAAAFVIECTYRDRQELLAAKLPKGKTEAAKPAKTKTPDSGHQHR